MGLKSRWKISLVLNEAAGLASVLPPLWVRNCVLPFVRRIKCEDGVFEISNSSKPGNILVDRSQSECADRSDISSGLLQKKKNQITNHHYVMFCGLVCEVFFFLTISVFIIRLVTWNRTLAECISPVCYRLKDALSNAVQ